MLAAKSSVESLLDKLENETSFIFTLGIFVTKRTSVCHHLLSNDTQSRTLVPED